MRALPDLERNTLALQDAVNVMSLSLWSNRMSCNVHKVESARLVLKVQKKAGNSLQYLFFFLENMKVKSVQNDAHGGEELYTVNSGMEPSISCVVPLSIPLAQWQVSQIPHTSLKP